MNRHSHRRDRSPTSPQVVELRIIGGRLRGRRLQYTGDPRTRPMKDRVREAVFNLVGPSIRGAQAIDLFAGTGALALEAISRGALRALAVERHFPTARVIQDNASQLGVAAQIDIVPGDAFIWSRRLPDLGDRPWVVFCCPPYALYQEQRQELLELIRNIVSAAPPDSRIVVEADASFDFSQLVAPTVWRIRRYPPAVVGLAQIDAIRQQGAQEETGGG